MKRALSLIALVLFTPVLAQDTRPAETRKTTQAMSDDGTLIIQYGSPAWKDAYTAMIKPGATWRLGNNDPTSITLDCGIMTASGPVVPGSYKLALECTDTDQMNLLVYEGNGQFQKGVPAQAIKATAVKHDLNPVAPALALNADGKAKALVVNFGNHSVTFPLQTIKPNKAITTEFAMIECTIATLALPVTDAPMKDVPVGRVTIVRDGLTTSWVMKLTTEGDKGTLTFVNGRMEGIKNEKAQAEQLITRIKGMLEKSPDMKERLTSVLTKTEEKKKELDEEAAQVGRLQPSKSFDATATARKAPAATLDFSMERPAGSVTFKFGVAGKDYAFSVVPRQFMKPREE